MNISKQNKDWIDDSYAEYKGYYELGDSYFWIAAHCDFVMKFIEPLIRTQNKLKEITILDGGCGYGSLTARLKSCGKIIGLDATWEACLFCHKKHGVKVTQSRIENTPFSDNTFDFIFAIDTIEHIKNDLQALKELYRILRPKGFLVVTVPAFMCLWGYHDEKYKHLLRYTKSGFSKIAGQAGFIVRESRYFKFLLFLPLLILRKAKRMMSCASDDFYKINPLANKLLHKLLNLDNSITSVIKPPFGANLFTILYKD